MISVFFCFILYIKSTMQAGTCNVVTHVEWGAQPATEVYFINRPIPYVIIEHTASNECDTRAECIEEVANIQNYHLNLDYGDIGPSFLIGGDGRVYEGTGWLRIGSHAYGYNHKSIGISFIGTFIEKLPTELALDAAQQLIICGLQMDHLQLNYTLLGHRQVRATESPGTTLYNLICDWPHWAENP